MLKYANTRVRVNKSRVYARVSRVFVGRQFHVDAWKRVHAQRERLARTCGATAQVDELVGPVALLDPVVVGQARVARQRVRRAVFALDVVGAARGPVRVQAELELAPGRADRRHCGTNEIRHL